MESFRNEVKQRALELSVMPDYDRRLAAKIEARQRDESIKPLVQYREAELAEMRRNFYGFDPSYHYARYQFVHKTPQAWTPRHLCRHRDIRQSWVGESSGWLAGSDESGHWSLLVLL